MMKKTLFETALDMADSVITQVIAPMLERPTPCRDWNMQALLNHLFNELAWVPELLAGKTIEQVGDALDGNLVGSDIQKSWRGYADTARQAAIDAPPEKVVHVSYGNIPASQYLDEMAADVTVHSWDVAQAAGLNIHIADDLAEAIYNNVKPNIAAWRQAGLVGEEKVSPPDATPEARLIALFGR